MHVSSHIARAGLLSIVWVLSAQATGATPRNSESGAADPRLQMAYQQARAEVATLTQENARLKAEIETTGGELEDIKKAYKKLKSDNRKNAQRLANVTANSEALGERYTTLSDRFTELSDRFRETIELMRQIEQERDQLVEISAALEEQGEFCAANNEALYASVIELADRYEKKGVFRSLVEKEPFTRIKKVQMENLVQEHKARAEALRLKYERLEQLHATAEENQS